MKYSILVVDDEPAQRLLLSQAFSKEHTVVAAAYGSEAMQLLERRSFDLVITDQRMPGMSGIELIRWIRDGIPEMAIVVLTARGSVETAVEAMKLGAQGRHSAARGILCQGNFVPDGTPSGISDARGTQNQPAHSAVSIERIWNA